jgi:hypothetical protein
MVGVEHAGRLLVSEVCNTLANKHDKKYGAVGKKEGGRLNGEENEVSVYLSLATLE